MLQLQKTGRVCLRPDTLPLPQGRHFRDSRDPELHQVRKALMEMGLSVDKCKPNLLRTWAESIGVSISGRILNPPACSLVFLLSLTSPVWVSASPLHGRKGWGRVSWIKAFYTSFLYSTAVFPQWKSNNLKRDVIHLILFLDAYT